MENNETFVAAEKPAEANVPANRQTLKGVLQAIADENGLRNQTMMKIVKAAQAEATQGKFESKYPVPNEVLKAVVEELQLPQNSLKTTLGAASDKTTVVHVSWADELVN